MRVLARWVFYTIGIPNLISFVLATGLGVVLAGVMPRNKRGALLAVVDFSSGLASVFAGIALLRLFGFEPSMLLPMISGIWLAIHFAPKGRLHEFFLASLGIVVGWGAYNWIPLSQAV
jgi:hypothetical protein